MLQRREKSPSALPVNADASQSRLSSPEKSGKLAMDEFTFPGGECFPKAVSDMRTLIKDNELLSNIQNKINFI